VRLTTVCDRSGRAAGHPGQSDGKAPGPRIQAHQVTGLRGRVEAAQAGPSILAGRRHQLAGELGRDWAEALDVRRRLVLTEQDGIGDDEGDRDGDGIRDRLPGHPLRERVGHDLTAPAHVATRDRGIRLGAE